jgi:hypothetical protein
MEAAFLALNDSFAEMGLRSSMIPEQTAEEETEGPIETVESELDLDLLLADLDKAITLATERVISGTVEQEIAYASGTRNRKKMLTPQNTPQKSLTPQMTPRDTPGSSKVHNLVTYIQFLFVYMFTNVYQVINEHRICIKSYSLALCVV